MRRTPGSSQAEIVAQYGLVAFADAEAELTAWIVDRRGSPGMSRKRSSSAAWRRAREGVAASTARNWHGFGGPLDMGRYERRRVDRPARTTGDQPVAPLGGPTPTGEDVLLRIRPERATSLAPDSPPF